MASYLQKIALNSFMLKLYEWQLFSRHASCAAQLAAAYPDDLLSSQARLSYVIEECFLPCLRAQHVGEEGWMQLRLALISRDVICTVACRHIFRHKTSEGFGAYKIPLLPLPRRRVNLRHRNCDPWAGQDADGGLPRPGQGAHAGEGGGAPLAHRAGLYSRSATPLGPRRGRAVHVQSL